MVLEQLFKPTKVRKKPYLIFFAALLNSFIGFGLSILLFKNFSSLTSVFLTVIALSPVFVFLFKWEEHLEKKGFKNTKDFVNEHKLFVKIMIYFFLGITVAFAVMGTIIPEPYRSNLFSIQLNPYESDTGAFLKGIDKALFFEIFMNNMRVIGLFFILSLLFGVIGSVLLISWNASVLGVLVSEILLQNMGLDVVLFLIPHTIIEISGYFFACLAGGIISEAFKDEKFLSKSFDFVVEDALVFLVFSILLVVFGALIESMLFWG